MVVKLLTVDLYFPGRSSLKEKRFVLSSIKSRIGRQPNVAVAEVDYHDKWQRSKLAIVAVGDGAITSSTLNTILNTLERDHRVTVLDHTIENR
jgi:uncharacterized protein YlxP (DUF503 family)